MNKEELSGILEHITFHNPENGFAVLKVKTVGKRDMITVVGQVPVINIGELINAKGFWNIDQRFGLQFKAETIRSVPPSSANGIRRYLSSGFIRGIGPEYGKRLVTIFGDKVLEVIEKEPGKLVSVPGIGPKRQKAIVSSWQEHKAVRQIMLFLLQHGIGVARAVKIWRRYGDDAIGLIRSNPYRLSEDIRGIGFMTADKIAQSLGIDPNSIERARAGLRFALQECLNSGHVAFPKEALLAKAQELLEINPERLQEALTLDLREGQLITEQVNGDTWIYLSGLWHSEAGVARNLLELLDSPPILHLIKPESAVQLIEKKVGISLSPSQRNAVIKAIKSKVMILTGGPGVGKTTIVRVVLELYREQKQKVVLCAPTGRAAKRLGESCGAEGKTLHRLLEADPSTGLFRRNRNNPLIVDLVVLDEASMVDISLMYHLLDAIPQEAAFLIVGDIDQLPSVGPGLVLRDMLYSEKIPVARLTEIFRQNAASHIIVNAHMVNRGLIPRLKFPEKLSDFYFINAEEPEEALEIILRLVKERIPARFNYDPITDIQIIAPMIRGSLGTRNLNQLLQKELNPADERHQIERFGWIFNRGDKIIQTVNDYKKDVFNGDIGFIESINKELKEVMILYDGRRVKYLEDELDDVIPAYAITIHKSQGCEFPAVIIPFHTQHYMMLQRNLLYTAITRGKRLVVIVGSKRAVAMAIRNSGSINRFSALKERLQGLLPTGRIF